MNFAEKLKKARKDFLLTQKELSKEIGVSVRTIRNYESSKSYPKDREIYKKLAVIFNVNEDYFKIESDDKFSSSIKFKSENTDDVVSILEIVKKFLDNKKIDGKIKKEFFYALQEEYIKSIKK